MKTLLFLLCATMLFSGCSNLGQFKAQYGPLSIAQGKDVSFDELEASRKETGTNGVIVETKIKVKGYSSNANVDAMRAENDRYEGIARGAAEGAVKGAGMAAGKPPTP